MTGDGAGRPSEFKEEFCQLLIEHMRSGLSFASFAGVVGKSRQTLYVWAEKHPEFAEAKAIGESMSLLFWEKQSIEGLWEITEYEDGKPIYKKVLNSTVWIFNMKNRFGWRDKQPEEVPQIFTGKAKALTKEEKLERSLKIRERLKAKK